MDRPSKLGPEAGVLRIGEILAWIKSRFREPPEHRPSTNPAEEATKPATASPQSLLSELASREFTDPRVQDWIDEQYRALSAPQFETDKPPAPPGEVPGNKQIPRPGEQPRSFVRLTHWLLLGAMAALSAFLWGQSQNALTPVGGLFVPLAGCLICGFVAGLLMGLSNWRQWAALCAVTAWSGTVGWAAKDLGPAVFLALVFAAVLVGGLLIGLFSPPGLWPRMKRWLATPERKQLATLVLAATWVSLVALGELGAYHRDAFARVLIASLPALLFGGILFWWFGRKPKDNG